MVNQGIKENTIHLSGVIGDSVEYKINVNKNNPNLYLIIPLFNIIGENPFDLKLYYTHTSSGGSSYGGMRLSDRRPISNYGNYLWMETCEGYSERFDYKSSTGRFECEGNTNTILREQQQNYDEESQEYYYTYKYTVEDKYGNKLIYDYGNSSYPNEIVLKNGNTITHRNLQISNGKGAAIKEIKNGIVEVDSLERYQNGTFKQRINFTYSSGKMTEIKYYTSSTLVKTIKIVYKSTSLEVIDVEKNVAYKFDFNGYKVIKVSDGYLDTSGNANYREINSITYNADNTTRVYDITGDYIDYLFDANDLLIGEFDRYSNYVGREYHFRTHNLLRKTGVINYNRLKSLSILPASLTSLSQTGSLYINSRTISSEDSFLSYLGSNKYQIEGNGTLYKDVSVDGSENDRYLLILPVKYNAAYGADYPEDIRVSLATYKDGVQIDYGYDTIVTTHTNDYEMLFISLIATTDFDSIKFMIETIEENSAYIGDAILYKKSGGAEFNYDNYQNLTETISSQGSSQYAYNSEHMPTQVNNQGNVINIEYDNEDRVSKILGKHNSENSYTYNSNDTIEKKILKTESKTITNEYEYDSLGNVTKHTMIDDNISTVVENEYDSYYLDRLTKIKEALSETTYGYVNSAGGDRDKGYIYTMSVCERNNSTTGESVKYTYKNGLIETVKLDNGVTYRYQYDDYKNIVAVYINDEPLVNFTYNNKNQIYSVKYPSDSTYYYFEYEYNRIKTVRYGSTVIKSYTYNGDLLTAVEDNDTDITTGYTYNSDDKLSRVTENTDSIITYEYDHLGNVIDSKTNVHNYEIIKATNVRGRASGGHTKELVNRYTAGGQALACFYDDTTDLVGSTMATKASLSVSHTFTNKVLPYIDLSSSKRLYYSVIHTSYCGSVGFWFKPTSLSSGAYLFKARYVYTSNVLEVKYIGNNKIQVLYNNSVILETANNIKLNEWNFFALAWKDYEAILFLNEKIMVGNSSIRIGLQSTISYYYMCHNADNTNGYNAIPCAFTGLIVGNNFALPVNSIYQYYAETKERLIEAVLVENNFNLVNHSSVNDYDFNEIKSLFEIYPLNNSFNSINGKKPSSLSIRKFDLDQDKSFNFNNTIKRYAYVADGSMLAYKFGNSNTATIAMRICQELRRSKQYLLYCYDSNNNVISLYTDNNGVLKYDIGSTSYSTGKIINVNTWYDIAFSYNKLSTYLNIRIVINGEEYTNVISSYIMYSAMTTIIGRCKDSSLITYSSYFGQYTNYPLYGLIEGLCYRGAYSDLTAINNLFDNYKVTSVIHHYDELGRLTKKEIVNNDSSILSTCYSYYQSNGYNFRREIIRTNDTELTTITYKLDKRGNVTNVSDELFGSRTYNYDYKGQLTNDDGNTIKYDGNGNIKSYDTITYEYDSIVKDKLIKYNGNSIYYNTNKLYPNFFGSLAINYKGNKVSSITVGSNEYTYKYTNGLRTHKYLNNNLYCRYYYEGNKLITEYRSNTDRLDFLYDSNGLLYGFINNKTDKYYYVRDMLQNIIGIIDSNGNLVVKYSYNAFGKVSIVNDGSYTLNSFVASRNPFRYKGYYYDEETGLFMVGHRYYNPEWCRWLTPDDVEYLEPDNINGLNLYAYCANDPVNKYDPDGHDPLPWWANMLIGVGVIAVLAAATVLTAGAAGVGVGAAFAAGFTGTAVGAGASGLAVTIASSAFAGAVIGGTTSMLASGIMTAAMGGTTEDILNSASSSFMFGTALGAFSGIVNPISMAANEAVNIGIHMGINSLATVGTYLGQTAYMDGNLNNVSFGGLLISAIGGASAGFLPNSIAKSGYFNYISIQGATFFDYVRKLKRMY